MIALTRLRGALVRCSRAGLRFVRRVLDRLHACAPLRRTVGDAATARALSRKAPVVIIPRAVGVSGINEPARAAPGIG